MGLKNTINTGKSCQFPTFIITNFAFMDKNNLLCGSVTEYKIPLAKLKPKSNMHG